MRGFKFSQEPEYERTGFEAFECQECGNKVQISGKKLMQNPPRWITRGQCKSIGCVSFKEWITTRVEPATLLVNQKKEDARPFVQTGLAGLFDHVEAIEIGEEE